MQFALIAELSIQYPLSAAIQQVLAGTDIYQLLLPVAEWSRLESQCAEMLLGGNYTCKDLAV
jgi:hypothetical protein